MLEKLLLLAGVLGGGFTTEYPPQSPVNWTLPPSFDKLVVRLDPYVAIKDSLRIFQTRYNETTLAPVLLQVATRFSQVLVHITEDELIGHDWNTVAPLAAARINAAKAAATYGSWGLRGKPPKNYFKLWISFHYKLAPHANASLLLLHTSRLSQLCAEVNSIYPGTIYTVMVHFENGFVRKADFDYLKRIFYHLRQNMITVPETQRYKLGLMYGIEFCHPRAATFSLIPYMKSVTKYAEVVYIDALSRISLYDGQLNSPDTIQWITGQVVQCRGIMEKVYGKKAYHFAISTGMPDSTTNGVSSVSNLVRYWITLAELGEQVNTTFLMIGAFDTPYSEGLTEETRGWWRLQENAGYTDPSQYVFLEKLTLAQQEGSEPAWQRVNQTWLETPTKFSRHVGVSISSCVKQIQRHQEDTNTTTALLGHVTRHFNTVTVPLSRIGWETFLPSSIRLGVLVHFPGPMAFHKDPGFQTVVILDQPPDQQDLLESYLDCVRNWTEATRKVEREFTSSLFLHLKPIFLWDNQTFNQIQRNLLTPTHSKPPIRFGVTLDLLEWCLQEGPLIWLWEGTPLSPPAISLVTITARVNWLKLVGNEKRYLSQFTTLLELCHHRVAVNIKSRYPPLEVIYVVQWDEVHWENSKLPQMVAYVRFWEDISHWADLHKVTVILGPAFDDEENLRHSTINKGWWPASVPFTIGEDTKSAALRIYKELKQGDTNRTSEVLWGVPQIIIATVTVFIVVFLFGCIFLLVVLRRLHREKYLTSQERHHFFKGEERFNTVKGEDNPQFLPYDKSRYEIKKGHFFLDRDVPFLGDGQFGRVAKGKIRGEGGRLITTAVKIPQQPLRPGALLGLLSEIKVLIYVGQHQNIVRLLGAHTEDIHKGIVYVFLEFCHLGSLHKHLQQLRSANVQVEKSSCWNANPNEERVAPEVPDSMDNTSCSNFLQWSIQIAQGMAYLASKYIVHADLATRNVLLTIDCTVKICDFGLSRRMYNYQNYIKTGIEPLPWRWMAPEALRFSQFTQKTDVWAFGVTIWEMYSLGETPYPGINWDANFALRLENGLRLPETPSIPKPMYGLLLQCWAINPKLRPAFTDILALLELVHLGQNLSWNDYPYYNITA